jgi:hypothetical protein
MNNVAQRLRLIGLAAALAVGLPATAGTIYRCTEPSGKIVYSSTTCSTSGIAGAEKAIEFPNAPPRKLAPPKKAAAPAAKSAKRRAAMRFFYDPATAPREHSTDQMEALIRAALAAWSAGCAVDLEYVETAPYVAAGTPEHVSIRWDPDLMRARHPANPTAGIAGIGTLATGVSLRQRMAEENLGHVIVHEIGHVLGLLHNHEDGQSVMSYLPDDKLNVQPSAADYLACNRAVKARFGIDIDLPAEIPRQKMNDKEALDRVYRAKQ